MWKLVIFLDEQSGNIVCSDWEKNGETFWPPYRALPKLTNAFKYNGTPGPTWREYLVNVVGTYSKYNK